MISEPNISAQGLRSSVLTVSKHFLRLRIDDQYGSVRIGQITVDDRLKQIVPIRAGVMDNSDICDRVEDADRPDCPEIGVISDVKAQNRYEYHDDRPASER